MEASSCRCLAWRTDNSRYVVDLDTPEDVAEVEKRLGQSLRMPCNSEARSGVAKSGQPI